MAIFRTAPREHGENLFTAESAENAETTCIQRESGTSSGYLKVMLHIKILCYKNPQRYAVKQIIKIACNELGKTLPGLEINVEEVKELAEMEKYTPMVILPGLVVNEKLVCVGRFPQKDEVVGWLRQAVKDGAAEKPATRTARF
jgi:hypothetical protein